MVNELRDLRLAKKIPGDRIVEIVRQYHPKFDKTVLSKCEHGEAYGVRIGRKALNALYSEFAPELLPKVQRERNGRHRLTKRISCRLEDEEHAALSQQIDADGYETVQDWLADMVGQYLNTKGETP